MIKVMVDQKHQGAEAAGNNGINNSDSLQGSNGEATLEFYEALKALKNFLKKKELYKLYEQNFKNRALSTCIYNLKKSKTKQDFADLAKKLKTEIFFELELVGHSRKYYKNKKDYSTMIQLFEKDIDWLWELYGSDTVIGHTYEPEIDIETWVSDVEETDESVKISVVMPCYNAQEYLKEALDSLLKQTLTNIQIICVNDGSTDETEAILKEVSEKDARVLVIDQENAGAAAARNTGLKYIKGEYVYYMDSDDSIHEKALEYLYSQMKKRDLDMLFFSTNVFFESEEIYKTQKSFQKYYIRTGDYPDIYDGQELFVKFVEEDDFRPSPCLYMTKTEFLKNSGIWFRTGIIMEDQLYTMELLSMAKKAAYDDILLYNRRIHADSIMTGSSMLKKSYSAFTVVKEMAAFAEQKNLSSNAEYYKALLSRLWKISSMEHKHLLQIDSQEVLDFICNLEEKEAVDFYFYMYEPMIKSGRFIEDEKQIKELSEDIVSLREKASFDRATLKKEINSLNRQMNNKLDNIQKLEANKIKLQNEISDLKAKQESLKLQNKMLENKNEALLNSWDYKIGEILLYIPKKILHIFKK